MHLSDDARVSQFINSLKQTQYLPSARLQAYQARLLAQLVNHAVNQTDFYPSRLAPLLKGDGTVRWDRWSEIPILTRPQARAHFEAMRARAVPKAAGGATEDMSSGSTGVALRLLTSDIQDLASACCSERFFNWHEINPQSLTVRIRAARHPDIYYPKGHEVIGWRAGHADSKAIDLSISTQVEQQVEWLSRVKPRNLATYPSNLRELARHIAHNGNDLRLDSIMTFGEMVTDDTRALVQEVFGKPVLDRYGSSEVGHIASTCPHSLKHHISSEVVLLELVDADGQAVQPGEIGRVIVTPFYNFAMPFIRYELGDYAIAANEPCGCGRTLPVLDRIMGRTRNVFRFADGTQVWPVLFSRDLQSFVPNHQFQVVQLTRETVEFRYVPQATDQNNDLPGLTAYLKARLHKDITVSLMPVNHIPRSAGGKFEDCMSLVT